MNKNILGHLGALLCVCIWELSFGLSDGLLGYFSSLEITVFRFAVAFLVLNFAYFPRLHLKKKLHELWFLLAGICGISLFYFLEELAYIYAKDALVVIILSAAPFFTAILSRLFNHSDGLSSYFFIGLGFALTGITLIGMFGAGTLSFSLYGALYALGASVCWGAYAVVAKRIASMGHHVVQSTRRIMFWGLIFMIPLCLTRNFDIAHYERLLDAQVLINMLALALFTTAACYVVWTYSLRNLGAVRTSVYIYAMPVVSVVVSAVGGRGAVNAEILIGVILTIVGLTLSVKRR